MVPQSCVRGHKGHCSRFQNQLVCEVYSDTILNLHSHCSPFIRVVCSLHLASLIWLIYSRVSAFNLTQLMKPYIVRATDDRDLDIATFVNIVKSFVFGIEITIYE